MKRLAVIGLAGALFAAPAMAQSMTPVAVEGTADSASIYTEPTLPPFCLPSEDVQKEYSECLQGDTTDQDDPAALPACKLAQMELTLARRCARWLYVHRDLPIIKELHGPK